MKPREWTGDRSVAGRRVRTSSLLAVGAAILTPIFWAVMTSLESLENVYDYPPSVFDTDWKWENYPRALGKLPFLRFLLNSALLSAACAFGATLTSSMAGYAFARLKWRGKRLWFGVLLCTLFMPSQILLIPHFLIYQWLGWLDTYKPMIVPAFLGGGAFNIFLFRQFFKSMPETLLDAARMDGASEWQVYRRIMLPLSRPVVATVAVLSFIYHWQDFLRPLIYLTDFRKYPVSVGLRMYQSLEGSWVNLLMAACLASLVPVVAVFFLCQRWVVDGLMAAARDQ